MSISPPLVPRWLRACALVCPAAAWLLLAAPQAYAQARPQARLQQDQQWVIIPSIVDHTGNPAHVARRVSQQLTAELSAHNRRPLDSHTAKRRFEQRGSAPPMLASANDIDELARDAQQALYHVASGLHSSAKRDVERAMERARRALESLNRETRAAQHLLDACLYLVRGYIGRNEREQAQRQALDCRRLVPDIEPEHTVHPPAVIGVLAEAEAALLAREPSSLRIESDPMGCAAFVNGRNLGTTPKELSRLSPGEYRVQVECHEGEPGRVHRVVLSNNRAVVRVDTHFDRVVQTLFDLSLRYQDRREERSRRQRDALEAARVVGASDLVSVQLTELGSPQHPIVEAERLRVTDGARLAFVRMSLDADGRASAESLRTAALALIREETQDLTGGGSLPIAEAEPASPAGPVVDESSAPGASPRSRREGAALGLAAQQGLDDETKTAKRTRRWRRAGYALGGAGVAASLVGWALQIRLGSLQRDYADAVNQQSPDRFQAYRDVEDFVPLPSVMLGVGSAALLASLHGWLPADAGVPWWGWLSGGLGVVGISAGAALVADARSCLPDALGRCTEPVQATRLGTQVLLQSLPLLAVPAVYGVRRWLGGDHGRLEVQSMPRGALVSWTSTL